MRRTIWPFALPALVAAGLLAAACGSSSSSTTTEDPAVAMLGPDLLPPDVAFVEEPPLVATADFPVELLPPGT